MLIPFNSSLESMLKLFIQAVFAIILVTCSSRLSAQRVQPTTAPLTDSIPAGETVAKKKGPTAEKRALQSAALPGWGQFNNNQLPKAAIFLAGVGGGLYTSIQTGKEFKKADRAYSAGIQTDGTTQLQLETLLNARKDARVKRDLAVSTTVYVYAINVIDAAAQYTILKEDVKHSPTKAAYYSALLPGLGQIYNKKWWKVPIVYGALGTAVYFSFNNRDIHRKYREELEFRSAETGGLTTGFRSSLSDENLEQNLDFWRQWRDFAYIATVVVYGLNIVDATVDAHLYDFDVDDDLAFKPSPAIGATAQGDLFYGIKLTFDIP